MAQPHDRILWTLVNHGGMMDRRSLRRCVEMRDSFLDGILYNLRREGKVRVSDEIVKLL